MQCVYGTVNIYSVSAESSFRATEPSFLRCLNSAITLGVRPSQNDGLGPATCHAIDRVAREHPDAAVSLISDAFDAFAREHGTGTATNGTVVQARVLAKAPSQDVARLKGSRVR